MEVLAEYGEDGSIEREYVYGMGLISMERGGNSYYYHTDHLGTVRFLTDEQGNRVESYDYDAFGNLLTPPSSFNTHLYTGEDWDGETSLLYLRARYYKPEVGRFISRDPVGYRGGMNLYVYVGNNPLNRADLKGTGIAFGLYEVCMSLKPGESIWIVLELIPPADFSLCTPGIGYNIWIRRFSNLWIPCIYVIIPIIVPIEHPCCDRVT